MGKEIKITNEGAIMTIAPISLTFAEQLLMCLKGSKLHSSFGVDTSIVANTPGDEFGCLSLYLDDSLSLPLDALNQLLGITLPFGVTGSQHISVSKNLFVFMILDCITKPEYAYRLHFHVETPSIPGFGKQRISPTQDSTPIEGANNE
ncbi:hypothetical protein [Pectobacterium versatile]|uniref:hypothetical protein n=1 Tax=Pectobacterium versatile TaxID=2488639 RepID=UPI00163C4478|nr:hypothetical protein [Pectobacterium versatile]